MIVWMEKSIFAPRKQCNQFSRRENSATNFRAAKTVQPIFAPRKQCNQFSRRENSATKNHKIIIYSACE